MLRLTGGEFRGRSIQTPPERAGKSFLRPTQAKLRQALFNSIQGRIEGAKVLDLFSGSGALGFEALSRGAESVVFVEDSRIAVRLIEKNAETLGVRERMKIFGDSVTKVLQRVQGESPFDIVFADPPYEGDWETWLLNEMPWKDVLVVEGIFCLEWGIKKSKVDSVPEVISVLTKIREKNYGDSILTTYQRSS